MCLHSPEEEKWHHLERGLAFPILHSLPSQVLHGTPEERRSLLCSSPPQRLLQYSRSFKNTLGQTGDCLFHSKTKNVMNFYSSRKGLAEVALDVPLNTNLQSQEKVTPSTLRLFPGAVTPRCWFPACPHGQPCSPAWAPSTATLLGKEQNICQRVPVTNAILIKIPLNSNGWVCLFSWELLWQSVRSCHGQRAASFLSKFFTAKQVKDLKRFLLLWQ